MAMLLIPELQPHFPYEDVSDVNADVFEQLMFEPDSINMAHEMAEGKVYAFRRGHAALRSLGRGLFFDRPDQQRSFSYGATLYEALATTVRPIEQTVEDSSYPYARGMVNDIHMKSMSSGSFIVEMMDKEEEMVEKAPRVVELFSKAVDYQPDLDRRVLLWGAVVLRSVDYEAVGTPTGMDFLNE